MIEAPGASIAKLEFFYVNCLWAFWSLFSIKADLVSLGKGLKSTTLDIPMVDKKISTVFTGNETKTLRIIEPLYCTCCHVFNLHIFVL